MSPETAEIMSWDMSHLTQQQCEYLHALRTLAQQIKIKQFMAKLKKETNHV